MSGQQFVQTLKHLGYPKAGALDARSFDWSFEDPAVAPFLKWFCNSLNSDNVISQQQLTAYDELDATGSVLDGRLLENALHRQRVYSIEGGEDTQTEESSRSSIEDLERDIKACNRRKQMLTHHRNILSLHLLERRQRLSQLIIIETATNKENKNCVKECQVDNKKVVDVLGEVKQSISNLLEMYASPASHPEYQFLSQLDLMDYYHVEEQYTHGLADYTRKQFFEGIAEMSSAGKISQHESSDAHGLLVSSKSDTVTEEYRKELQRLRKCYLKTEPERINALVTSVAMTAAQHKAGEILNSFKMGTFERDINRLRHKLQNNTTSLQHIRKDLLKLSKKEVPGLIKENAASLGTCVFTGDYNLKIMRQNYLTSKQKQVISQLVEQRARNMFVQMAYMVEVRRHRDIHQLVTAIIKHLDSKVKNFKIRLLMMEDSSLAPYRHERETITSRDSLSIRLNKIITSDASDDREHQLFPTYAGLLAEAEHLHQDTGAAEAKLSAVRAMCQDSLSDLEKSVAKCFHIVYSDSTTTTGQPNLTPEILLSTMSQLDDMLNKLMVAVSDIISNREKRQRVLKIDPLEAKARKLHSWFFTKPENVVHAVKKLTERGNDISSSYA